VRCGRVEPTLHIQTEGKMGNEQKFVKLGDTSLDRLSNDIENINLRLTLLSAQVTNQEFLINQLETKLNEIGDQ